MKSAFCGPYCQSYVHRQPTNLDNLHRSAWVCKRTGVNGTHVNVLRRCCCAFSYPHLNQFSEETLCPFHKRQPVCKAGFQ